MDTLITEITFAFCINKDSDQVHKKSPACISRINDDERTWFKEIALLLCTNTSLSHKHNVITLFGDDVDLFIVLKDQRIPYFANSSKIPNTANPKSVGTVFQTESHLPLVPLTHQKWTS